MDALYPHINQSWDMGYPQEGAKQFALLRAIPGDGLNPELSDTNVPDSWGKEFLGPAGKSG